MIVLVMNYEAVCFLDLEMMLTYYQLSCFLIFGLIGIIIPILCLNVFGCSLHDALDMSNNTINQTHLHIS